MQLPKQRVSFAISARFQQLNVANETAKENKTDLTLIPTQSGLQQGHTLADSAFEPEMGIRFASMVSSRDAQSYTMVPREPRMNPNNT